MDLEEFRKRRVKLSSDSDALFEKIEKHAKEEKRFIKVLHNAPQILDQLENVFEERTSLNKLDRAVLMLATGLQLSRIYLLEKYSGKLEDENKLAHNDPEIKRKEHEEMDKFKKVHNEWKSVKSEKGYRSWQEIAFTTKVPYDATRHAGFNDRNMHGGLHRVKTLGHDPILGWIFGTCNILTDTISITPEFQSGEKKYNIPYVETYGVDMGSNFCWTERKSTISMFSNAYESVEEDWHRLAAAIFSQSLHFASDVYTKQGLPVPFLSFADPDKAYEVYQSGYDYLDLLDDTYILRKSLKSVGHAIMINKIIAFIHKLFFYLDKEKDSKLYEVRTRKIILWSNVIATSSDVIQTSIRLCANDANAAKDFDLGGFLVTLYRLTEDVSFIQKVEEEFVFNEWDRIIESNDNLLNI